MTKRTRLSGIAMGSFVAGMLFAAPVARADGDLNQVNHIIIMMQENHSFDNYYGVLPYVAGGPYHAARRGRGCDPNDHTCVDGLSCKTDSHTGQLVCRNKNPSNFRGKVRAFHEDKLCTGPDLDHSWIGSHEEGNFKRVNSMLRSSPNNGFVKVNAETEGPDQVTEHDTMGYYDDGALRYVYEGAGETAAGGRPQAPDPSAA